MRLLSAEDAVLFVRYMQELMLKDGQEIAICMMGDAPFLSVPTDDGHHIYVSVEDEVEALKEHHLVSYELPLVI